MYFEGRDLGLSRFGLGARLGEKPWTGESLVRLVASVFICIYAGSLATAMLHCLRSAPNAGPRCILLGSAALVSLATSLVLLRLPWRLETLMKRLGAVLVFFYGGIILGIFVQKLAGPPAPSIAQMVIAALSFQGSALVFIAFFLREHGVGWNRGFGFREQWKLAVLLGILAACVFLPLGWLLQWGSAELMTHLPHLQLRPEEQQSVQTLRMAGSARQFLILGVITILLAPVAEEMLFRGILYPWVKQLGFPRLALWSTSLLFAAVHMNLVTFVPLLLLAVILAQLYERTANLLAPICAHALFNGLNFTLLYLVQRS